MGGTDSICGDALFRSHQRFVTAFLLRAILDAVKGDVEAGEWLRGEDARGWAEMINLEIDRLDLATLPKEFAGNRWRCAANIDRPLYE